MEYNGVYICFDKGTLTITTDKIKTGIIKNLNKELLSLENKKIVTLDLNNVEIIDDKVLLNLPNNAITTVTAKQLKFIPESFFNGWENLSQLEIPNVESIGKSAFANCKNLKNLKAPNVKSIGETAFANCKNLRKVKAPKADFLGISAFSECPLKELTVSPDASVPSKGKYIPLNADIAKFKSAAGLPNDCSINNIKQNQKCTIY